MADRQAELLPVPYYHVVFTLPAAIGDIAYHNKTVSYGILFKAAAETLITIAADPKHLGARIGLTAVLHTWGSALIPIMRLNRGVERLRDLARGPGRLAAALRVDRRLDGLDLC